MSTLSIPPVPISPRDDAVNLYKAFKGFGCDTSVVIDILAHRDASHRSLIQHEYKAMYSEDILHRLSKELTGKLENAVLLWMQDPASRDAVVVRQALIANDLRGATEVICSRTPSQIQTFKQIYHSKYATYLEHDLERHTSGDHKKLLLAYVSIPRYEGFEVDKMIAENDAKTLYRAGEKRLGTDEDVFIKIFSERSRAQLAAIDSSYTYMNGHSLEKAIKKETSGVFAYALLTIVRCAENPAKYFAKPPTMGENEWNNKSIELFLDLLIESKKSGKTKFDWPLICKRLNAGVGMNWIPKSLENYHSDLKLRFKAWRELKSWTGLGWNPTTGCPEVDPNDEKWKAFVTRHRGKPKKFLLAPLPFEEKMMDIYGGTYATGNKAWSSGSSANLFDKGKDKVQEESQKQHKEREKECEEGEGDSFEENMDIETNMNYDSNFQLSVSPVKTTTISGKKRKSMDGGQSSSKKSVTNDEEYETCMQVLRENIKAQLEKKNTIYDRLVEAVHEIPEIAKHGKSFIVDCLDYLTTSEKNGEMWLALPDNEYRLIWLKKKISFPDDVYRPQFVYDM